jgi:hypothetical protein
MRGTTRSRPLACILGRHKRGSVARVERRLFSECHHCGIDLVRKGRRWRRAAPNELPSDWKAQHTPHRAFSSTLLVAVGLFTLVGAALFMMQL